MRGAYAFSTGLRRRAGAPEIRGFESGFDSDSGVRAGLILDLSGAAGGQFYDGTDNTKTFGDLFTFTRASLATQKDSAGLVKFAPHNLNEDSEDIENQWTLSGSPTFTAGATLGGKTSERVTAVGDQDTKVESTTIPVIDTQTYTLSVFARKQAGNGWMFLFFNSKFGDTATWFDLTNGVTGTVGGDVTASITAQGDDFYLCSITSTCILSGTTQQRIEIADANGASVADTGDSIDLIYAQVNATPMAAANDTFAATYVPTTGAAVFQHRLDHDKDGNRKGLLIEESRTNTFKQANDFDTTWDTISAGAMSPSITGPDGVANSAWKLVDDNSDTGAKSVVVWQNMTSVALSTLHTLSLYMKKGDSINFGMLRVLNFTTPGGTTKAWFDLENGVVGTKDVGFTTSDIEDAGNGWYRCWVTWTTDVADNSGSIYIQPAPSNGNTLVPTDGTSFIHLFGAQFEPGGFPSSYIPTKAVAVTRAAESATVATSGFAFNAGSIGSVITTATKLSPSGSTGYIWQLDDGTNLNRISHYISSGNLTQFSAGGTGSWVDIYGASSITAGVQFKSGFAWADNNGAHTLDGGTVEVDASGTAPSGITTLGLGHNEPSANQYINGHTASLVYYAVDLSDADLVAGTT